MLLCSLPPMDQHTLRRAQRPRRTRVFMMLQLGVVVSLESRCGSSQLPSELLCSSSSTRGQYIPERPPLWSRPDPRCHSAPFRLARESNVSLSALHLSRERRHENTHSPAGTVRGGTQSPAPTITRPAKYFWHLLCEHIILHAAPRCMSCKVKCDRRSHC